MDLIRDMTERQRSAFEYWKRNPVKAVQDWFHVTPEDYQCDIINDLLAPGSGERSAAKSSHGVGKTTTEAWVGWVFLMTRWPSRVVATAPTQSQLHDVLWPEFEKWRLKMPPEIRDLWATSASHIRHKVYDKSWFATARTSNKQENMQGFHDDSILVIAEEASGINQQIFEPIEGILTNAEEHGQEAKLLMVGNPTQTAGEFFDAFHKNAHLYNRYTISGDPATKPDRNAGKFYISKRVSAKYRETMASKYGADGPVYDVRVRGLFPREADDVVIPLGWAERAVHTPLPHFDKNANLLTVSMDVARFGGDETVVQVFRNNHMIAQETWPKTSTTRCVDILGEVYYDGFLCPPGVEIARIVVDEPGVGGGVIDGARREDIPIVGYNGQAVLVKGRDPDRDFRMFSNRRSRDWWHARRLFENNKIHIINDEILINQLASVKFDYVNEKIKVETKKEMKERLGDKASPDRADTLIMGVCPTIGVTSALPLESLLTEGTVTGPDRPTAEMDF